MTQPSLYRDPKRPPDPVDLGPPVMCDGWQTSRPWSQVVSDEIRAVLDRQAARERDRDGMPSRASARLWLRLWLREIREGCEPMPEGERDAVGAVLAARLGAWLGGGRVVRGSMALAREVVGEVGSVLDVCAGDVGGRCS